MLYEMSRDMNIFVGARVCRGIDWKWGRQEKFHILLKAGSRLTDSNEIYFCKFNRKVCDLNCLLFVIFHEQL